MDKIAKQKLNVVVMVDCSKSMQGERIGQVNKALQEIKAHLTALQAENATVDFYLTVLTFSNEAKLLNGEASTAVEEFSFQPLKGGGWSNLHLAYELLEGLLQKQSKGGMMPDFGGIAPILLLMTDGHPTKYPVTKELEALKKLPWFKVALKYGIAIELNDTRTHKVLREFVGTDGEVIECYDARLLERIIKIIVLTASKVKSTASSVHYTAQPSPVQEIKQQIGQALAEVDDWEW